jgi:arylsulfatase A-like enzyme
MGDHGQGLGEKIRGKKFWGHHVHVNNVVSRVPLFVAGQGLPQGEVDHELTVSQLDIMPTLFDYLGVTPSPELYIQGYSIYRLLADPVERSVSTEAFGIRGKDFFKFVRNARSARPGELRETFTRIASTGKKYSPKIAIQRGRYKILYDRMLRQYWLYDIVADPYEKKDLSKSQPGTLAEMTEHLLQWRVQQAWTIEQLRPLVH